MRKSFEKSFEKAFENPHEEQFEKASKRFRPKVAVAISVRIKRWFLLGTFLISADGELM